MWRSRQFRPFNRMLSMDRKLHTSGRELSGGADVLPLMPSGRVGLDAGSGATGVLANTRRDARGAESHDAPGGR